MNKWISTEISGLSVTYDTPFKHFYHDMNYKCFLLQSPGLVDGRRREYSIRINIARSTGHREVVSCLFGWARRSLLETGSRQGSKARMLMLVGFAHTFSKTGLREALRIMNQLF